MVVLSVVGRAGKWNIGTCAAWARLTPVQCVGNARYPVPVPRMVVLREGANEL